jgi:hypothetical protein
MEQSNSWETNSRSINQEIPHLLWVQKVHYRVHKSPPLDHIMKQMHPVHIFLPPSLRSIITLSSHLHLGLPSGLIPSSFPNKFFKHFSYIIHACYMTCTPQWHFFGTLPLDETICTRKWFTFVAPYASISYVDILLLLLLLLYPQLFNWCISVLGLGSCIHVGWRWPT